MDILTLTRKIFNANPALKELYAFDDGNVFENRNFADIHKRKTGRDYCTIMRTDALLGRLHNQKSTKSAVQTLPATSPQSKSPRKKNHGRKN